MRGAKWLCVVLGLCHGTLANGLLFGGPSPDGQPRGETAIERWVAAFVGVALSLALIGGGLWLTKTRRDG
ncbi:MAG: hypothetical protein HZB16_09885 [Armatimonadetes bacterium]|nr:hypothetical protein [Armatimonadota bacterium]